ncbi:DUF2971 domain-containing protein [Pseudomonas frederiksbergensis]|uniref:DUF2971 domain-containing protein n=1 Tax=Pseudomonas frederiksbergensis TaxID=104087 RepID=A0A423KIW3_9PSED|nr:DUF2971 domain-containing protein [Pseudomonas frederiksbergensis]RON53102.1 hypothetical protein BK665_15775 [Pseudomonas frederiksbergensis]
MVKDDSKTPLTCFKYRSGESALRCLVDGTLYFAKPDELNDVLETKFDHAEPEAFNQIYRDTISEVSQKRDGPRLSPGYPCPPDFVAANTEENKRFRNACDNIGIFSAARRPNDQAMWAYYAENCRGMCFELEWSASALEENQLLSVDVTYSSVARQHNRAEDWRTAFLELSERNPSSTLQELYELSLEEQFRRRMGILSTARVTSIKHTDWAHEREIRLLSGKAGARPLLKSVLKRVHFMRTDGDKWGPVVQEIHRTYPEVQLAQWTFHHGEITASARSMMFKMIPVDNL